MELVIDTNCLISALIKPGESRKLICSLDIKLYAPEDIILETLNYKDLIISKSGISNNEFNDLIKILLSNIKIIQENEFRHFKEQALKLVKHPEDTPFIALCIAKNIPLWSNDKELKKQNVTKVFSTSELLKILRFISK